jgi:hypothetical protein
VVYVFGWETWVLEKIGQLQARKYAVIVSSSKVMVNLA